MRNLKRVVEDANLRRTQAEVYYSQLEGTGVIAGVGEGSLPQSHFAIRVPASRRNAIADKLRGYGVDTGTLFSSVERELDAERFPHARCAAEEVLTLPLGPSLTVGEVERISGWIKSSAR
jgi:dTDP-4-amino-4,6-dideoxygalactose transaminase